MAKQTKIEAVFLNGLFQVLLDEIVDAGKNNRDQVCYIQPRSKLAMATLKKLNPSPEKPLKLYASLSTDLNQVSYEGEIVGWKDKRELSDEERTALKNELELRQKDEGRSSFEEDDGSVKLILVRRVDKIAHEFPVSRLIKASDSLGCQDRTQAGGLAYIGSVKS